MDPELRPIDFDTITREDGSKQLTYKGWPLYLYSGDTKPFEAFAKFAEGADLVIHDCTFDDSLVEKAGADGHSTPSQAAAQAKDAEAKQLALSHISARYPNAGLLLEQAKKIFPNTVLAEDFMELELPLSE